MIITCPNCNKQFKIDNSLIPDEGRNLQCGLCNHVWFYKIEEKKSEILKFKLKNNIFTFIFVNNINLSSDFLSNNIKKIFVEAEDVIIIDQEMLDCDVNYTIKLVDNNIYKYKIKVVRNKNGI